MFLSTVILAQAAETAAPSSSIVGDLKETFVHNGVNGPDLLAQAIVFLVVALALKKFAYGPILKVLEERRALISQGLENAEKIKAELANAQAHAAKVLHEAGNQANGIIAEARKTAEAQIAKAQADAAKVAEAQLASAREQIAQDRQQMLRETKNEVLGLVSTVLTRVSGKVLTAQDQERLKSETLAVITQN
ncbi:F-type H+-transporting ATPase subunit b [Verrucomicrobium sp. GAS474]|uniref:F0F1 ATP synthase subunit B n=1 Tax=Verrucomicrobium sp. GAS474 TaxID=1882831 RepID=UPI0008792F80|nr:F0F1 ATP synthase subunit B [Verrucomicrobium sp. GAS474]SDT87403.1 F-type H+-transporting ATPase subunit b [Verrucomicrobium sp. GAS474]